MLSLNLNPSIIIIDWGCIHTLHGPSRWCNLRLCSAGWCSKRGCDGHAGGNYHVWSPLVQYLDSTAFNMCLILLLANICWESHGAVDDWLGPAPESERELQFQYHCTHPIDSNVYFFYECLIEFLKSFGWLSDGEGKHMFHSPPPFQWLSMTCLRKVEQKGCFLWGHHVFTLLRIIGWPSQNKPSCSMTVTHIIGHIVSVCFCFFENNIPDVFASRGHRYKDMCVSRTNLERIGPLNCFMIAYSN